MASFSHTHTHTAATVAPARVQRAAAIGDVAPLPEPVARALSAELRRPIARGARNDGAILVALLVALVAFVLLRQ